MIERELKATLVKKTSKKGNDYECVMLELTPTYKKVKTTINRFIVYNVSGAKNLFNYEKENLSCVARCSLEHDGMYGHHRNHCRLWRQHIHQ